MEIKAIVAYEPMFGNTRVVAESIPRGPRRVLEVTVVRAGQADTSVLNGNDFVVVGGPTYAQGHVQAEHPSGCARLRNKA